MAEQSFRRATPRRLRAPSRSRLLDPARAAAEGRDARERVERSHDLRTTNAALAALYDELLDVPTSSSTERTIP